MSATVPGEEETALKGYMLGPPHGRSDSGWPVEAGPSRWDPADGLVKLEHTEEDKAGGKSMGMAGKISSMRMVGRRKLSVGGN